MCNSDFKVKKGSCKRSQLRLAEVDEANIIHKKVQALKIFLKIRRYKSVVSLYLQKKQPYFTKKLFYKKAENYNRQRYLKGPDVVFPRSCDP
ncbi:MAG: hypothetical protein ACLUKE_12580 [Blautia wexlerae]